MYSESTPGGENGDEDEQRDVLSDAISKCCLCQMGKEVSIPSFQALDGRKEEYKLQLLFHSGQNYHATCANFWVHAVQEKLPGTQ